MSLTVTRTSAKKMLIQKVSFQVLFPALPYEPVPLKMTPSEEKTSKEALSKELQTLEKDLAELEQKQQEIEEENDFTSFVVRSEGKKRPRSLRLRTLSIQTESLILAQELATWMDSMSKKWTVRNNDNNSIQVLLMDADRCATLAELLLRHPNVLELSAPLYEEYYIELFEYCYGSLIQTLRELLTRNNYPRESLTSRIYQKGQDECHNLPSICESLFRIESLHNLVLQAIEGQSLHQYTPAVIMEMLRPIVEKVRFHFVLSSQERITSNRIDRLPEWLLGYLKEQIFYDGGPYDLILQLQKVKDKTLSEMPYQFINELVRLIQWVFMERKFFRDPKIVGPKSNPILLYNAMEQLIQFDKTIQKSLPTLPSFSEHDQSPYPLAMGLMDILVVPDDELMSWWIEREKESIFSTLFDKDSTKDMPRPLANVVSPRAEIFCALIRSTQIKASVLRSPGRYLREVAVPLCSHFVDALHEAITDLRSRLMSKENGLTQDLAGNVHEWMEVINGTYLASTILKRQTAWQDGVAAAQSDHDLARFGRSLENLQEVMIEEFSTCFVETILMERARCASYLMVASHLMASQEWDVDEEDVSVELKETKTTLDVFLSVCNSVLSLSENQNDEGYEENRAEAQVELVAPMALKTQVLNRLANNFLEVALDVNKMTPDIWQAGAKVFARDVKSIFEQTKLPLCLRLLETIKLLTMDSSTTQGLFFALAGLVGTTSFLEIDAFSTDQRLLEEATSMVKAKGFLYLQLEDVISILNRRRD